MPKRGLPQRCDASHRLPHRLPLVPVSDSRQYLSQDTTSAVTARLPTPCSTGRGASSDTGTPQPTRRPRRPKAVTMSSKAFLVALLAAALCLNGAEAAWGLRALRQIGDPFQRYGSNTQVDDGARSYGSVYSSIVSGRGPPRGAGDRRRRSGARSDGSLRWRWRPPAACACSAPRWQPLAGEGLWIGQPAAAAAALVARQLRRRASCNGAQPRRQRACGRPR